MSYLALVLISIAINVAVALLMPKPKQKTDTARDLQAPTAEAGRPIPVVFGTVTVKSSNVLWYGEKGTHEYKVRA